MRCKLEGGIDYDSQGYGFKLFRFKKQPHNNQYNIACNNH